MSAASQLRTGDTVYGQHGQEAEFVARSGGDYIVRPVYEDEDGPQTGDVETWNAVFRTPPSPKLDADTAAAEKRLAEINAQISKVRTELNELTRNEKERLARIKTHDELAELDRYLAGEITHYVAVHDYYPTVEIIPVGETMDSYSTTSGYGLLTLHPSASWDKKVRWQVTYKVPDRFAYSRTTKVLPCCGEQEAMEKAREFLRAILAETMAKEVSKRSYAEELVKSCKKFGVEVPQELVDGIEATTRASYERQIAEHRQKAADLEKLLPALGNSGATP